MSKVAIVGVGRVGGALALALDRCGYIIQELITRDGSVPSVMKHLSRPALVTGIERSEAISADIVIIATPDPDIESAATSVATRLSKHATVFHTSGSLSSEVLSVAEKLGHATGSIHPLIAVSDAVAGAAAFSGSYFCIEGMDAAVRAGREIVARLGGHEITVETAKKPLYHAAAVMSAGHLVALLTTAHRLIAMAGVDPDRGKEALLMLSRSAIMNLTNNPPEEALTGPFARLDIAAFRRHLELLGTHAEDSGKNVYLALGAASLDLVRETEANKELRDQFIEELNMAKANSK